MLYIPFPETMPLCIYWIRQLLGDFHSLAHFGMSAAFIGREIKYP
jgi:hypothetical protein